MTSALQQSAATSAMARTAVAQRQTVAVPSAVRQNSGAASARRGTDDASRTLVAPAETAPISPFNQGARLNQAASTAAAATTPAAAQVSTAPEAQTETTPAPAATTPAAALDVLRAALRKANIEPSGLNLYYEEIPVYYPGGSYVNHFVTLELASGRKESYDVNLMLKNPWLTAFEIGRFMGYVATL